MYKVKIKEPKGPRNDGGLLRELTVAEREKWYKRLAPSKYAPHQGAKECARRVKQAEKVTNAYF